MKRKIIIALWRKKKRSVLSAMKIIKNSLKMTKTNDNLKQGAYTPCL